MLITPTMPALAQEPISEEDIDAMLVARGYPQMVLDEMSITAKESICKDTSCNFEGAIVITYQQETGSFSSYEVPEDGIVPMGQIPGGDLSLVLLPQPVSGNKNQIKVTCSYKWNALPLFRLQDSVAISWDDKLFEMVDNSFYKVDKYNAAVTDPVTGATISYITGAIHSEEYGYANGSPAGVTWYADLKGHSLIPVITSLYGHSEFTLRKKTTTSGTSTLYVHYVHAKIGVGTGINIGDYGNFSVTGVSDYDECGDQKTFSY